MCVSGVLTAISLDVLPPERHPGGYPRVQQLAGIHDTWESPCGSVELPPSSSGLAVAAAGLTAFQSGPAHAATVTTLPITSVYQVLADTAHGHVFISQGPLGGADAPIVVTNLSGSLVATIGDGAKGLALSANDATLYAAVGDTVTAYQHDHAQGDRQLPAARPGLLARPAGQQPLGELPELRVGRGRRRFDLATGTATWNAVPGDWVNIPPAIAVDPSDTGVLVTSSVGEEPPFVTTYNVSNPSAVTQIASCDGDGLRQRQPVGPPRR